jgi:uncharacterized protein YkwD
VGACDTGEGRGGGTRTPEAGRTRGIRLTQEKAKPSVPAVTEYGAAVSHTLTPVEESMAKALGGTGMQHQPALSAMARELSMLAPDHLNMPPALVDGLLAWFGIVDPPPRVVVVEIPADQNACHENATGPCAEPIQALIEEVRRTVDVQPGTSFGVSAVPVDNGNTRLMVAIVEKMVQLEPLPATVSPGGRQRVSGRLIGSRTDPRLEVIDPKGHWTQVPVVAGTDGSFDGHITCGDVKGAYQIEVMAAGDHGPEVAANFPIFCGVPRPATIAYEIEHVTESVDAGDVARANFDYLNRERETRGLAPLEWDEAAARIALAHSRDMYASGFVGHVSPTTGDVTQRFAKAGLEAAVIRENVARGYGPKGMHESLMSSPGHRVNIVASDVTHVGIGVVIGKPETSAAGAPRPMFLTQNFYKKPGAGAPKDLQGGIRELVDDQRKRAKLPALRWDDGLDRIAQKKAEAVARGREGMTESEFQQRVFALGFGSVSRHQVSSSDHTALAGIDVWQQLTAAQFVGLGVARVGQGRQGGKGGFVLIIVVAEK